MKKTWPICAWRFLANLARKPAYVKFLLNGHSGNRVFALTMFRIWTAVQHGIDAIRRLRGDEAVALGHRPGCGLLSE